jgi:ABC-type phosphate transport system permease subunit
MKPENLYSASKDQLNLVLSFFSRVDAKLSVVLAVDTGMFAVLGADSPPIKNFSWFMIIFAAITILLLASSIVFLYRGAFPSLKGGHASLIYFREIAGRTEHKFIEEFKAQTDEQHVNDLLGQVWRNSEILKIKFDSLKMAFTLLALAIIPWIVSLALFASYINPSKTGLFH